MPRYKLTLEYHGGPFAGWQRQDGLLTVQGALETALTRLDPAAPSVTGAGRTDAGVHALGQVAHVDLARDWDGFRLAGALNHHLRPHPVAVLKAERAADAFHARFDAVERTYRYRLVDRRAPLTVTAGLVWRISGALDVDAMRAAAATLVGRHDFTTFRAAQCQAASPVKTLDALHVARAGAEVHVVARARSFLHSQVRSLVGALALAGLGRLSDADVAAALAARDRRACPPVAPPDGLYFETVMYPNERSK
jgi:tRNA pseudouridine38-40 synthase